MFNRTNTLTLAKFDGTLCQLYIQYESTSSGECQVCNSVQQDSANYC